MNRFQAPTRGQDFLQLGPGARQSGIRVRAWSARAGWRTGWSLRQGTERGLLEEAQASARSTALSVLGSLKFALGDLDRVSAWLMVHGMVNAEPG